MATGGADAFISEFGCKTGQSARLGCDEYVCWVAFLWEDGRWKKTHEAHP